MRGLIHRISAGPPQRHKLPPSISLLGATLSGLSFCVHPPLSGTLPAVLGLLGSSCLKLPPSHTLSRPPSHLPTRPGGAIPLPRDCIMGHSHGLQIHIEGAAHVHHACCPIPSPEPSVLEKKSLRLVENAHGRPAVWRGGEKWKPSQPPSAVNQEVEVPGRERERERNQTARKPRV